MEKKKWILLGAVIILILLGFVIHSQQPEDAPEIAEAQTEDSEDTTESKEVKKTKEKEITYENIDGLYFLNDEGTESFKDQVESWLMKEGIRAEKIRVYGKVLEADQTFTSFLIVSSGADRNNVQVICRDDDFEISFVDELPELGEEEEGEVPEVDLEEERALADESYDPDLADAEVEAGMITVTGDAAFPAQLDKERFIREVTEFLENKEEYRRALTLQDVEETERKIVLNLTFDTPRLDGKWLQVTWNFKRQEYSIGLLD